MQFLCAAAQPTAFESSSRHGRIPMESHMDTECCARIAGGSRRGDFPHRTRVSAYRRAPVSARSSPESARSAPPVRAGPGSWWTGPDPPRIHEIYRRPARRSGRARRRDHAPGEGPGVPQGPAARCERGRPRPPWSAEPWMLSAARRGGLCRRRAGAVRRSTRVGLLTHTIRV